MTAGKWRTSSRSNATGGNCVRVRTYNLDGSPVEVGDSKAPQTGNLAVGRRDFAALLATVR